MPIYAIALYICCLVEDILVSAMLQLLRHRELGQSPPRELVRCETARRLLTLQLSKYQDVEPVHSTSVNSLDLDPVEQR